MAELLHKMLMEYDFPALIDLVVSSISKELPSKSIINFLSKSSELFPKELLKHIGSFTFYLDHDCYSARSCFLEILKNIVVHHLINENEENAKSQLKSFFRIFDERYHDVSSIVRAKNLGVVEELCRAGCLPLELRSRFVDLTISRLKDKSSTVRKKSIKLLLALIETHPFAVDGGILSLSFYEKKVIEVTQELEQLAPQEVKKIFSDEAKEEKEADAPDDSKMESLLLLKRYYSDGIAFIKQIHGCYDTIVQLISSVNKTEVIEAIDMLITCHCYEVDVSMAGLRKLLHLIWVKDNSHDEESKRTIKEKLLNGFMRIFSSSSKNLQEETNEIVKSLLEFTFGLSLAELTSLEQLLCMLTERDFFSDLVCTTLWQVYSSDTMDMNHRRAAIILISMMSKAKKEIVEEKVDLLLKVGLGLAGNSDSVIAKYSLISLQRIIQIKKGPKGSGWDYPRLVHSHEIFYKIVSFVEDCKSSLEWYSVVDQAINTIYLLADKPDKLCNQLLKSLVDKSFRIENYQLTSKEVNIDCCCKLIFAVGHVAIKQIVHLEYIDSQYKKQNEGKMKEDRKGASAPLTPLRKKRLSVMPSAELEQVSGTADDEFADLMFLVKEQELLFGKNSLLALFSQFVVAVCSNDKTFNYRPLQIVANMTLCKFMCISSEFCEANLQLLLTIIEKSKDEIIRSNSVIALGDIAMCYNNLVDQNIASLYKRLQDPHLLVKRNTLMVLTHLILNGMIKVKGQIGELAKCVEDTDNQIRDLSRMFFSELATKDNVIYNLIPDIVSTLCSDPSVTNLYEILKFIFAFLKKDKQTENIAEKLCQRFKATDNVQQWRDISFCLSLIPFNSEKAVQRLIENFSLFEKALTDETSFNNFHEVLIKLKKQGKSDLKASIEEFERKMDEASKKHQAADVKPKKTLEKQNAEDLSDKMKALRVRKPRRQATIRRNYFSDDESE